MYQYGLPCIFTCRMLAELFMLDYYISEYGYTFYISHVFDLWLKKNKGVGKMIQLHRPISSI